MPYFRHQPGVLRQELQSITDNCRNFPAHREQVTCTRLSNCSGCTSSFKKKCQHAMSRVSKGHKAKFNHPGPSVKDGHRAWTGPAGEAAPSKGKQGSCPLNTSTPSSGGESVGKGAVSALF